MLTWVHTFGLAWLAIIRGDTEEAERLATEALEIGAESGQPDAAFIYGGQLLIVHHQRGVLDQLRALIEEMAPGTPSLAGVLWARDDGRRHRGRSHPGGPGPSGHHGGRRFRARDEPASGSAAWRSTPRRRSSWTIPPSPPRFSSGWRRGPINGPTTAPRRPTPISHFLGGLSTVLGRYDDADRYFARSAVTCQEGGAKFFLAQTELLWARMLLRRGADGDERQAAELLRDAHATATAHGYTSVQRRVEDARASIHYSS